MFALNLRWLLRDFLLELVDEEGRRMTPDEWLGGSTDSAAAPAQLLSLHQSECEVNEWCDHCDHGFAMIYISIS